jgi:hypothetical protein
MSWTVDLRIKGRSFLESVLSACFNPHKTEHPYGLHKVHGFSQGKYFNPGDEFRWESRDGIRHRDESEHHSAVYPRAGGELPHAIAPFKGNLTQRAGDLASPLC